MPVGLYRLTNPTIALHQENGHHIAHTVPTGALIKVTDESFNGNRLVNVEWGGLMVMMFAQDLRTRTKAADEKNPA